MSFPELLEAVKALPRTDKIQLLSQLINEVGEVTQEEAKVALHFGPGATIEIREPVFAPEAAAILLEMLETEKRKA